MLFWHWFVVAVGLGILEMVTPGFFFLWLAGAAALVGIILLAVPMELPLQVLLFAVVGVSGFFITRRYWKRGINTDQPQLNRRAEQYIGQTAELAEAIAGGHGKVALGDTQWSVTGPDLPKGVRVRITGADGAVLRVEAVH